MSTLRSALEELRAEDLASVSDAGLESDLDELERAGSVLEAERARRLAEFERRGTWRREGHLSVSAWLASRHRVGFSDAERRLRLAGALPAMPQVAEALGSGEVSASTAGLLAAAREASPERFALAERSLVDAARSLPARELGQAVTAWRISADRERAAADERARWERRRLRVGPDPDGMQDVAGKLDPENGQSLLTAIRAVEDDWARHPDPSDRRTPEQRRADALGEICRRWLDSSDRPRVGTERPHVVVTMDLAALEGRSGGAELEDAGPITPEAARRLACDASVARVITGGRSEPLDVGRKTSVVPAAIRRAVVVRDRRCRFPGCDRPHAWCDSHHVRHWADGGATALDNLVLLCRPHHRLVHQGFGLEMRDGRPAFSRPDGSPLEDRAPP
jgi:hypothetical protein